MDVIRAQLLQQCALIVLVLIATHAMYHFRTGWDQRYDFFNNIPQVTEVEVNASMVADGDTDIIGSGRVQLVHDQAWFWNQTKAGCCPHAVRLYEYRFSRNNNRCCTDRLDEIEPWRPMIIGEEDDDIWASLINDFNRSSLPFTNQSIVIQGDSLAEQHFIAILCHAWSLGVDVASLERVDGRDENFFGDGLMWEARIGGATGFTFKFIRGNKPALMPGVDYSLPRYLIVGGWHHGGTSSRKINLFLDELERIRAPRNISNFPNILPKTNTLVVQALPSHFPGNLYRKSGDVPYPSTDAWSNLTTLSHNKSKANYLCDTFSRDTGNPNINDSLNQWMKDRRGMEILKVQHLYRHRGDAHIGPRPAVKEGRDCLHWCVAPGVLDSIALETLSMLRRFGRHPL